MVRKKTAIIIVTLFVLLAISLTVYVSVHADDFRVIIKDYVETWGYAGVLILSFILDFLEQPIGPDIPISMAVLAGLNVGYVVFFAILGSYASSIINYYIGRSFLSNKIKAVCRLDKHERYCSLFSRHGKLALFLASISPVPWVAFCWLAGSFNIKFRDFVLFGLIPRAIRFYTVGFLVWYFRFVLF